MQAKVIKLIRSVAEMRSYAQSLRRDGRTIVLVPTMGGLHAGHVALATSARNHGDHVVVSIFVNPTQFSAGEDYAEYPRNLQRDCEMLRRANGADTVFAPTASELYPGSPQAQSVWVDCEPLSRHLCGPHRPGHFRGVLTVVAKLFNCCLPHTAILGLKDAQQYFLIWKLTEDLCFGVRIVGHPTVRANDGLALSSRNAYLNADQRAQSVVVFESITAARRAIENGERSPSVLRTLMEQIITESDAACLQYAEVVSTPDLQPVETITPGSQILVAVAVCFGTVRLIDNALVQAPY